MEIAMFLLMAKKDKCISILPSCNMGPIYIALLIPAEVWGNRTHSHIARAVFVYSKNRSNYNKNNSRWFFSY